MKRSPLTLSIAALLIIIFGLMLFVFQVRKSEVAVVTLFGKMEQSRIKTEPGAYLQLPWPIEKVYHLDQRVQVLEDRLDSLMLPDQNIILLQTYTGWRIADPYKFFPKFDEGSVIKAGDILSSIIASSKLEVAGKHGFSDFLSADPAQMKLPAIEQEILDKVREKVLTNDYGIEVQFVQIHSIELPESDTENVFSRMKSERGKIVAKISADALVRSNSIVANADSRAAKTKADAEAQAKEITGQGQAAMVSALQILRQNPDLASFIMDLDMLEELSKAKTTWILDHTTPGLELLQKVPPPAGQTNGAK